MYEIITSAILTRTVVSFYYEGEEREVCPTKLGVLHNGNLAMEGYWVGGYSKSRQMPPWRLYLIDKITHLQLTGVHFDEIGPEYKSQDKRFASITICL